MLARECLGLALRGAMRNRIWLEALSSQMVQNEGVAAKQRGGCKTKGWVQNEGGPWQYDMSLHHE